MKNKTKTLIDVNRLKFYLWVGLGWTLLWLFSYLANEKGSFLVRVPNEIWRNIYLVVVNFIFFEYSLPFIRKKRKNILFNILIGILLVWIQLMLVSFGLYCWRYLGIQLHIYTALRKDATIMKGVSFQSQGGVTSTFFFGIAKLVYDNFKLRQTTQQLRIEKQEAELHYLKSQTNPHFLFNTLNNIYSLAQDKSDLAPESILRLSKILRFMLYETGGAYISIEQELKVISDYIALEKLRYDDSLHINFNYDIEDMKQAMPPLLLMPLVENAFKHGVSETRNQPFVDIHLSVMKRQLEFLVKNSTEAFPEPLNVKENIGLTNLRRQLELLYKDFNLSVRQGESAFTAILKINLASHV
ncbi:MAG TPA: histidine kinase [Chitinophagales bacterium]|nr:histidine kinase [Chitinophagales bacterium]